MISLPLTRSCTHSYARAHIRIFAHTHTVGARVPAILRRVRWDGPWLRCVRVRMRAPLFNKAELQKVEPALYPALDWSLWADWNFP